MPVRKAQRKKGRQVTPEDRVKQEKIDCLVQEAENGFEQYKKNLWEEFEAWKEKTQEEYAAHLRTLPEWVKKMTVAEVKEKNIDFNFLTVTKNQRVDTKSVLSKFMSKNNVNANQGTKDPVSLSKKKMSAGKRRSMLTKKIRPSTAQKSRILPSQPRKTKASESPANDSYEDVSDDEVFFTPSHQPTRRLGPITPKFDSSKPILRSQLRRVKPGELVVSLSGSPILLEAEKEKKPAARTQSDNLEVTVRNKVYNFSELETLKRKPRLNERRQILELQKKLDQMLQK